MLLEPYEIESAKSGVLCISGGRYKYVGNAVDGYRAAEWLNSLGYSAWVLNYPTTECSESPLNEGPIKAGKEAIDTIREKYKGKLGVWGWSAGGHLAAMLITNYEVEFKFAILLYPVIGMDDEYTHHPSRENLLGEKPKLEQIEKMSAQNRVTATTPPCFIFHTAQDESVPKENSILFAEAINRSMVPFVLKIQREGGHGIGFEGLKEELRLWVHDASFRTPTDVRELDTSQWRLSDEDLLVRNHSFVDQHSYLGERDDSKES